MDELLCKVQRPGRYLGNEFNLPVKDWQGCDLRVALAFPDLYEVGMSHLGFLILYEILNRQQWVAAERVFAPWPDMEQSIRSLGRPLSTLESGTPLGLFDVVGFSLQYELSYTNVLTMLELGGITLRAADRRGKPLVIGGGACAFNPEPLAPFFDAFALGDGEELVLEIARTVAGWKSQGASRRELLEALSDLEGVYVPSFFTPHYGQQGRIEAIVPRFPDKAVVRKRILPWLEMSRPADHPLVPCTGIVHDRLVLEVMRGCTRGCRFCQAGFTYRPVRERSCQQTLQLVEQGLAATGHEELSLLALSIGDYSGIQDLLHALMHQYQQQQVAVSLPSLRVGTLDETMIEQIRRVRKTGFTLAPEAGSPRLRLVINKPISEKDLLETARAAYLADWPLIKLYFMMGLPTETAADREDIVRLSVKVWQEAARHRPRRRVHVSVSTFVPKPHTAFQWEGQLGLPEMEGHLDFFRRRLAKKGLHLKWQQPYQSMLEGIFARGDRRLAGVLLRAQRLGCRFDGWSDQLRPDLWRRAFAESGLDPSMYHTLPGDLRHVLPWSHLDCGVSFQYLWSEYERALAENTTADCRLQGCANCGVCDHKRVRMQIQQDGDRLPLDQHRTPTEVNGLCRYRLLYAKVGSARFLSHLETASVFRRAIRRAGLPLAYSEGYHPSPRLSLGEALPVGIESLAEEMELTLRRPVESAEICRRLDGQLPSGLSVIQVDAQPDRRRWSSPRLITYEATLFHRSWPPGGFLRFRRRQLPPLRQKTKKGERSFDLHHRLLQLKRLSPESVRLTLYQDAEGKVRVRELLAHIFGISSEELGGARIVKISSQDPQR